MNAYYNENDRFCAQWLRNLIAAGHIASGDVDERNIADVRADDLRGYTQCHFFAGIGGWSCALRLAGWPDDRPVWTGSCPCQPFSAAGAGKAADDERHLWPAWLPLIAECAPAIVFGEQVEAAVGWGWLDAVFADLEAEGYACGAAVLPACSVGAPHIRQRLWFVADACSATGERLSGSLSRAETQGDSERPQHGGVPVGPCNGGAISELADAVPAGRPEGRAIAGNGSPARCGGPSVLVDAPSEQVGIPGCSRQTRSTDWRTAEWIPCTDGKARPVEPGTFPLAHGIAGRVGRLRAYGNAIVPQVAAEFILAAREAIDAD